MSQYSASSSPPVTAAPLMAPITGLVIGGHCGEMSGSSVRVAQLLEVQPAQNTGSAPVRMTTSTAVVGLGLAQRAKNCCAQRRRQRVARLRPVQRQGAHPVCGVDEQHVVVRHVDQPIVGAMCRNITELRGLEPAATAEEIEAAARQYVRKVSGITRPSGANAEAFETAVAEVTATSPPGCWPACRRAQQPPKTVPPLRRPEVRARHRSLSRRDRTDADPARAQGVERGGARDASTVAQTVLLRKGGIHEKRFAR